MTMLETVIGCLQGQRTVRLDDLVACAGHERRQVLRVMDKLAREGYLAEIGSDTQQPQRGEMGPHRRNPTWRIIKDPGKRPQPNRPRNNSLRSKLWRLIRAKRRFTKSELSLCSGVSTATTDEYVRDLERAGYVRATGKDGHCTVFMLVKVNQVEAPTGVYGGGK